MALVWHRGDVPRHVLLKEFRRRIDPDAAALGSYRRLESRIGRRVTQEELAEAIGVSRAWYAMLESRADVRASTALLDRLADALMIWSEERAALFDVALPELKLAAAAPSFGLQTHEADASPADLDAVSFALARARHRYHLTGILDGAALRSRVLSSWERCRSFGVDPDIAVPPRHDDLASRRAANERLLRAANPIISHLTVEFSGTGYAVLTADPEGTLLHMGGDPTTIRRLAKMEIETGGDWGETAYGTNAIGTAVADRRPIQLLASEHFCEGATGLTCTAAPIFVPGTLELAGILDVSAPYTLLRPHLLGFIMQAALEIEERWEA